MHLISPSLPFNILTCVQAEHHERELHDIENAFFYREPGQDRSGVLTTNDSKHLMCTMTNSLLREVLVFCISVLFCVCLRNPSFCFA